jgi:hypothetical protein
MDVVQFLLVLAVLVAAVALIAAPLRRGGGDASPADARDDLAALEAARESKYREIREADLDRRTGKLSEEDWQAIDRQLRSEAIEILRELDRRGDRSAAVPREDSGGDWT